MKTKLALPKENLFGFLKWYYLFNVQFVVSLLRKKNRGKTMVRNMSRRQNLNLENNLSMKFNPEGNMGLKGIAYYILVGAYFCL